MRITNLLFVPLVFAFGFALDEPGIADEADRAVPARTQRGLQVLYDFASDSGPIVKDRAGFGRPINLRITDLKTVRRSAGSLDVRGKSLIRTDQPPSRLIEAIRRSGEITIEAWIRSANVKQEGPARIVTLSKSPNERNFTLGQEYDRFDARLRTSKTSKNGMPSLSSAIQAVTSKLIHVVYTRDRSGKARLFVDGRLSGQRNVNGGMTNWNNQFQLGLANELSGDRPWLGTFFLAAVYNRALSLKEIQQNFKTGAKVQPPAELIALKRVTFFESNVAPLVARNCLECHDSATRKGGLNLSKKMTALTGGKSGKAIVPGNLANSRLWQLVNSNTMPKGQSPLSTDDKDILKRWISDGATWSLEVIDPAIYAHGGPPSNVFVQRLTVPEYIETVRSAVGVDIEKEARELLPRDIRADGFSNTSYNLAVDLKHVDAYARLAEVIVSRMDVLAFARRFSKSRKLSTDDTMRQFVAKMGKWLLRGPLEDREVTTYSGIATTVASAGGNYKEAVTYLIEAMLQSPRFIYRIENQRGDGTNWPVSEHELASRLSYIIWGGPPDEKLIKAADDGQLSDRERCRSEVRRMLTDPRAVKQSSRFLVEWLHLDRLDNLKPNTKRFPKWDPRLAADMKQETLAFFEEVAWKQNRPLSELLNAEVTFATSRLAKHYGLEPVGEGNSKYDLSKVYGRGGLLTQASILTVGGDDASMVTRGLFVMHDLLRGIVKDPPPCVDSTPVPTKSGLTQRGIAEARIANINCGGCHAKFEPLAFGLEKFDGLGRYHEKDEHGNKLRDDGEILIPGAAKSIRYQSSRELMKLLAKSERVRETITWKVAQFALGRPLGASDARAVAKIHKNAQDNGGTYAALISAIVMSDLVQSSRTEFEN